VRIGAAKRAGVRKLRRRNGYAPCAITGSGDVFRCLGPKVPQALGTPFLLVLLVIAGRIESAVTQMVVWPWRSSDIFMNGSINVKWFTEWRCTY